MTEWLHLKQYGYAPGDYLCKCHKCGKMAEFVDKRAITCRPCAEAMHANALAAPIEAEAQKPKTFKDAQFQSLAYLANDAVQERAAEALASLPLAGEAQKAVEWQTPPASWRLIAKAALNLLWAIDEKHDNNSPPLKYSIPYGAVNDLRRALGAADQSPASSASTEAVALTDAECRTAWEDCEETGYLEWAAVVQREFAKKNGWRLGGADHG